MIIIVYSKLTSKPEKD